MKLALDPLAFPVIVTPYGIAALIVFLSFAPDVESQIQIGLIVVAILALDLLVMLFARKLLTTLGIFLAILGAVLAVVQVALGLQIIHNSLRALNIL
jgi:multiple antibiotic resistance protein